MTKRNSKGQFIKGNKSALGNKSRTGMKNSEHQKKTMSEWMKKNRPMKKGMQPKNSINWKGKNHPLYGKKRPEMTGENNPRWRGGVSSLRQQLYHCLEYKRWREKVFERDNWTCQTCKQVGGKIEAHHKDEFYKLLVKHNITTFEEALKCKELWDVNNGITLCKKCHNLTKKFISNQYVTRKN